MPAQLQNSLPYSGTAGNLTQLDAPFQTLQGNFSGTLEPSVLPTHFKSDAVTPQIMRNQSRLNSERVYISADVLVHESPQSLHTDSSVTLSADTLSSSSPNNPNGEEYGPGNAVSKSVELLNTGCNYGSQFGLSSHASCTPGASSACSDHVHDFMMDDLAMNTQPGYLSMNSTTASMTNAESYLYAPQFWHLTADPSTDIVTAIPTLEGVALSQVDFRTNTAADQPVGPGLIDIYPHGSNSDAQQQPTVGISRMNRQSGSKVPRGKLYQGVKKMKQDNRALSITDTQQQFQNPEGQLQGSIITFRTKQPGRGKLDAQTRAVVARTRQIGACPRCRKLKKPVKWLITNSESGFANISHSAVFLIRPICRARLVKRRMQIFSRCLAACARRLLRLFSFDCPGVG
jgi:hypothetical protein